MKKILVSTLLLVISLVSYAAIQSGEAEITFENTSHNFGTFSESSPKVTCTFKILKKYRRWSIGYPSALHHVDVLFLSIPKEPIKPGESGQITVIYNGAGKFPGHFKKSITIRSNGKNEMTRLYIEGDMLPKDAKQ